MIVQGISILGAALILLAFALLQSQKIPAEGYSYQLLNVGGGAVLLVVAIIEVQIGFILLEGSWTVLSAVGLWKVFRNVQRAR